MNLPANPSAAFKARILAIDPGSKESAFVVWDGAGPVVDAGHALNEDIRSRLIQGPGGFYGAEICAIEMVACYGMAVGADVFETCVWIGRFVECWTPMPLQLVFRKDVKMHLCQSMRAKDPNIRQALIDKHGAVGTTKNRGPLFGVSKHIWAALAVADYAREAKP